MKREYFYTDSEGKTRPYHYCSECGNQYNDDELKANLIINVGSETTPIKYCATPCLGIKFPTPPEKRRSEPCNEKPIEPDILLLKSMGKEESLKRIGKEPFLELPKT